MNTCSPESSRLPLSWIKGCIDNHRACKQILNTDFLPTRLIDVGTLEDKQIYLRVPTEDHINAHRYVTLSHRWGSADFLRLMEGNVHSFRAGIAIMKLSKTFQDAIQVTRWLGVRYLWIDALCIIQGPSLDDWMSEATKMRDTYAKSWCNISSVWPTDPNLGFAATRAQGDLQPERVRCSWLGEHPEDFVIFDDDLWSSNVKNAPLNKRAWVLQERVLSPRQLYFARQQIFWECHEQTACEMFPMRLPPQLKAEPGRSSHHGARPSIGQIIANTEYYHRSPYGFWKLIVDNYTVCQLTKSKDKLIAVSGLAQYVASLTGDTYLAGMWKKHLQQQMTWIVEDPPVSSDLVIPLLSGDAGYRAPSWSWASLDSEIRLPHHYAVEDQISLIEILETVVKNPTSDLTGQVTDGYISLSGMLIPCKYNGKRILGKLEVGTGPSKVFAEVRFDVQPQVSVDGLFCIPFYHSIWPEVDGRPGEPGIEGLVVHKVVRGGAENHRAYQRLGSFTMLGAAACAIAGVQLDGQSTCESRGPHTVIDRKDWQTLKLL